MGWGWGDHGGGPTKHGKPYNPKVSVTPALSALPFQVDPPRAGLDEESVTLLQEFDRVLYVSCNPDTLRANLASISGTHTLTRFACFDQFPYTHHLECGAYLVRRGAEHAQ